MVHTLPVLTESISRGPLIRIRPTFYFVQIHGAVPLEHTDPEVGNTGEYLSELLVRVEYGGVVRSSDVLEHSLRNVARDMDLFFAKCRVWSHLSS